MKWSRLANENHNLSCDICERTDRPVYVLRGENGKSSILMCDFCSIDIVPEIELKGEKTQEGNIF
jgi:hypothetical protein